jgi:hypothetical protein
LLEILIAYFNFCVDERGTDTVYRVGFHLGSLASLFRVLSQPHY